ncbi:TPA: hypothetical protein DCE37_22470 [Candidatus Latescibacteria bacterium]|nr:hypothetical protein [Candidatus Latescibacterota bacterium]
MVVDVAAFTGAWPTHPVNGRLDDVVGGLQRVGVDRILVSPLDAVWCRNPHLYNGSLYRACEGRDELLPVPVVDPSIGIWKDELGEAAEAGVQAIRLLPNYHDYSLGEGDAFWDAVSEHGFVTIVQTRMEDPRRQHPKSVVEDVPVKNILDLADRRRDIRFVIGGARTAEIRSASEALKEQSNLYADVSQADGLDAVRILVGKGLMERLLFGSHAPLFIPEAAMARVVTDLEDEVVEVVLEGNAGKLLSV